MFTMEHRLKTSLTLEQLTQDTSNLLEHFIPLNSGKPEAVGIGIIIAGALSMAFNEGCTAELFKAGARRGQCLPGAFCPCTGVL